MCLYLPGLQATLEIQHSNKAVRFWSMWRQLGTQTQHVKCHEGQAIFAIARKVWGQSQQVSRNDFSTICYCSFRLVLSTKVSSNILNAS